MKIRLPAWIVFQVVRNMSGEKNVVSITTIHYPLRDADASAGDVRLFVQISDFIDRTAVNSHSYLKLRMTFQLLADLERAQRGRFRTGAKNQRATVPCRQTHQLSFCFGETELVRPAYDLLQRLNLLALLVDE